MTIQLKIQRLLSAIAMVAAGVLITHPASAAGASPYKWQNVADGIVCGQFSPQGVYLHQVDDSICFKAVGVKVEWKTKSSQVVCVEETPTGGFLQIIANSYCVDRLGVKNNWVRSPEGVTICAQTTPAGDFIQPVDTSLCNPNNTKPVQPPAPGTPGSPGTPNGPSSYRWSDGKKTMCIAYNAAGVVQHMAPPAMCPKN